MSKIFRYYQEEADDAIYQELLVNNKCIVKMFCGSGKSLLMRKCKTIEEKNLVVYVFPSLSLIDQFYGDYLHDFPGDNVLRISSENEATTDPVEITSFLQKKNQKIICITYQSFKTLIDTLGEIKINVCIFDEAHHAVGETYQKLIFENDVCEKQIFFTATPKNANGVIMYDTKQTGMCGKLVYDYSYLRGVNNGYLNPFEIRIDIFSENTNKSVYESISRAILSSGNNRVLTFHADVSTARDTSVNNFVNDAEFKVVFKKVQEAEFPDIKKYRKISMIGLSSSINGTKRRKILDSFDTTKDNQVIVISSCETIGEGIDTKHANMCVFVDPKSSYVKIIQNIGRIVRKEFGKDKPKSTILIPCWVDKTKYLECAGDKEKCDEVIRQEMAEGGNFNGILNVLSALKQEDEELYDICLHYPDTFSPQEIQSNLEKQGYTIDNAVGDGTLTDALDNLLDTEIDYENYEDNETDEEIILQIAEDNDVCIEIHTNSFENPVQKYNSDCENGEIIRLYKTVDEDLEEVIYYPIVKKEGKTKRSKHSISEPKKENRFNIKVHTNSDIKVLWNITEDTDFTKDICSCVIDCEVVDKWYEMFDELKQFIEDNKKRPSSTSKNKNEKKLGEWISNQQTKYKNKTGGMKNEDRYNLWTEFIEEYKEYFKSDDDVWYETVEELKQFIRDNNKGPKHTLKNKDENKLANWISRQTSSYDKKTGGMKNEDRYNLWTDFIEEYKEYLKSEDEVWYERLEQLKQFIELYKKKPDHNSQNEDETKLYSWISYQQTKYKNTTHSMKNENKYNLWTEFLEEYKDYFKNVDEVWNEQFGQLKQFIEDNNKRPSPTSKNSKEKTLGIWLTRQVRNYKNKAKGMKDEERYKLWTEFLEEYKEYLKSDDEVWYESFEALKQFICMTKNRPCSTSKNKDEKKIANWLNNQVRNYTTKTRCMKDKTKHDLWREFLEEYKEYFESDDEVWYKNFKDLKQFINEHKKRPVQKSSTRRESKLAEWISTQTKNYKNKINSMKDETRYKLWTEFIEEYKEYFESDYEVWYENFKDLKQFVNTYKKRPNQRSKIENEQKLGRWLCMQLRNYKNKIHGMKDSTRCKLWTEFLEEYKQYFDSSDDISNASTEEETPDELETTSEPETNQQTTPKITQTSKEKQTNPKPKKSMKLSTTSTKKETTEQKRERIKTEISVLHQKYKTLKSENLHKLFNEQPELWHNYHKIAEENEQSFPEHEIPRNRIITELNKIKTKRTKLVVDMGCGKGQISQHFHNDTRFQFINYDHISSNETIRSCDISDIPLGEDTVEICILSLAMWGSNCKKYVVEANRILESGGKLYIIEPTKRWTEQDETGNIILEKQGNKLTALLEECGFKTIDQSVEKFCMYICIKV